MSQKLKSFLTDDAFFYTLLIILVAVASFGLGRYSVIETSPKSVQNQVSNDILIETKSENTPALSIPQPETASLRVVGSKSGTKYHLPDCPGAKQMKEENKIYFDSVALAAAAGYTPAGNCPGL